MDDSCCSLRQAKIDMRVQTTISRNQNVIKLSLISWSLPYGSTPTDITYITGQCNMDVDITQTLLGPDIMAKMPIFSLLICCLNITVVFTVADPTEKCMEMLTELPSSRPAECD